MDNIEIQNLILNVFKPDKSSADGAFCLPCVLFGDHFPKKANRIKKLFCEPFTHWNDATCCFRRHVGTGTANYLIF